MNGPPEYQANPGAYRADWERWRGGVDNRIRELHDALGEIKVSIERNARTSSEAHGEMQSVIHQLDVKLTRMSSEMKTWGKALGVLVAVAGIVIPLVLSIAGK